MGKLSALEEAKIDQTGDRVAERTGKELAAQLLKEAAMAMPKGVPPDSPYAKLARDELISEASRVEIRIGALLGAEELRIVLEHHRMKLMSKPVATTPVGATQRLPMPPVPMQPTPIQPRIRGLKESKSDTWRVKGDKPIPCSVDGAMTVIRPGAVIERRHYSASALQGMINQGINLVPIEIEDDED